MLLKAENVQMFLPQTIRVVFRKRGLLPSQMIIQFQKKKKLLEHGYMYMLIAQLHTWAQLTIHIKSSRPLLYPPLHLRDKLIQDFTHLFLHQVTKSWVGPGN